MKPDPVVQASTRSVLRLFGTEAHMAYPKGSKHGAAGFSLTELLMVVALLGLAAAVAVPQLGSDAEQHALAAARTIIFDMQYAQDLAVTCQSDVTVVFDGPGRQYYLTDSQGQTLTHPLTKRPYRVEFQQYPRLSQLNIAINLINQMDFSNDNEVTFDSLGTPTAAGTITLNHSSMDLNVMLEVQAATGRVTVSRTQP